jgi:hypothetical protein
LDSDLPFADLDRDAVSAANTAGPATAANLDPPTLHFADRRHCAPGEIYFVQIRASWSATDSGFLERIGTDG